MPTPRVAGRRGGVRESHVPALALAQFRTVEPTPPPSGDVTMGLTDWGMLGNDEVGDCGAAATFHGLMAKALLSVANGEPTYESSFLIPTTPAVEGKYFAYGRAMGEPGEKPDQGVTNATWLHYLFTQGIIEWYGELDPKNPAEVHQAALDGKGVLVAVDLTATAEQDFEDHQPWHLDGGPGDHDVLLVAYDDDGFTVVTWGGVQRCTGQVSEAWVFGSREDAGRAGYTATALIAAVRAWGVAVQGAAA